MKPPSLLRALIPYLSVGIFWCGFHSAWLALLSYHAAILFFRDRSYKINFSLSRFAVIVSLITLPSGILTYFFLENIISDPIAQWLSDYNLEGLPLFLMVPYFGLIHPFIEQLHWAPLRQKSPLAHLLFAGYHLLVLASLFNIGWLLATFFSLSAVSYLWLILEKKTNSLAANTLSHIFADFGLMVAVLFLVT